MITWWPLLKERKTWPSVGDHIDFSFKWKMFSGLIIFYFIGIVHKGLKKRRFQIENDGSCLGHPLSSFLSFDINQKRKRKEDSADYAWQDLTFSVHQIFSFSWSSVLIKRKTSAGPLRERRFERKMYERERSAIYCLPVICRWTLMRTGKQMADALTLMIHGWMLFFLIQLLVRVSERGSWWADRRSLLPTDPRKQLITVDHLHVTTSLFPFGIKCWGTNNWFQMIEKEVKL